MVMSCGNIMTTPIVTSDWSDILVATNYRIRFEKALIFELVSMVESMFVKAYVINFVTAKVLVDFICSYLTLY